MAAFDDGFANKIKVQSWSMYAVALGFIGLRMYASISKFGRRNLRIDDILMIPALALYTGVIVGLNAICQGGGSIPYPPDADGPLSEAEIQERIKGSKIVIINEQCLLNLLYILKCCMLVVYTRLTLGLNAQRLVRLLSVYVALCWTATQAVFFSHCQPFSGLWEYPPPNRACTTLERYELAEGVLNITSDVLMLCVPVPLVVRVRMPWRQKFLLVVVLSTGGFVIVAALLTKIFDLTTDWSPEYMLWYVRESSVAVYVANMPIIWPLLLQWFPRLLQKTRSSRESSEPVFRPAAYQMPVFGTGGTGGGSVSCVTSVAGREHSRNRTERRASGEESQIDIITALHATREVLASPQRSHPVLGTSVDRTAVPMCNPEIVSAQAVASDSRGDGKDGNEVGTSEDHTEAMSPVEACEKIAGDEKRQERIQQC